MSGTGTLILFCLPTDKCYRTQQGLSHLNYCLAGLSVDQFKSKKNSWSNDQADLVATNSYRYVLDLKERMKQTLKLVKEKTQRAQLRYTKNYDRKAKQRSFEIGDWVLVLLPTEANKLLMQWKDPFMVDN